MSGNTRDFLVELGTEELPPKSLKNLRDAFAAGIRDGLQKAASAMAPCTPTRRRVVWRWWWKRCWSSSRTAR